MADSSGMPARPSKRASSSSKQAAGAARSGRSVRGMRERPKLLFPIAIVAICVIGVLVVAFSRNERVAAIEGAEPPRTGDHWHAAYGVYICDSYLPPIADNGNDPTGIHTHGDGLMHIHPFGGGSAGFNARVGVWAETVGMELGSDSFTLPDGATYSNGNTDCDGEPADVYLIRWDNAYDPEVPGEVFTSDFGDVRFKSDQSAFTFAVVPESKINDVPRPDVEGEVPVDPTASIPTDLSIPEDLSGLDITTDSTAGNGQG